MQKNELISRDSTPDMTVFPAPWGKDILLETEGRVKQIGPVLSECEDYKNLQENS